MKGVEILVIAGILLESENSTFKKMGEKLLLSQSQVFYSVGNLVKRGLIYEIQNSKSEKKKLSNYKINVQNCYNFLTCCLKFLFPMEIGAPSIGIETLSSRVFDLNEKIIGESVFVWEYASGDVSGYTVKPIHKNVPQISLKDKNIYSFFVTLDFLRSKNVRDNEFGKKSLEKIFNEIQKRK